MSETLLSVKDLVISSSEGAIVKKLNFVLQKTKTLAIVGESGSGKSISSLALMGLLAKGLNAKGSIIYNSVELISNKEEEWQKLRGKDIAMIFQEPMSALNPSMTCGKQVAEILQIHTKLGEKEIKKKVLGLFEKVELPRALELYRSYPHQLSGGQKQRVMIAMAIACDPKILIADEPTTALDVSVQAGILSLLKKLQEENGMAMLFISHDLGVVRKVADEILVMHLGQAKEHAATETLFKNPQDSYTKGLLACRPTADTYYRRLPLVRDFMEEEAHETEIISPTVRENRAMAKLKQEPLFQVKDLAKIYRSTQGLWAKKVEHQALNDLAFEVYPQESLGLVGESGSGKTTLGRILVGLEKADRGQVFFKGEDIVNYSAKQWRLLHKSIQIIFQDPFTALNPKISIGDAITAVIQKRKRAGKKQAVAETKELLEKVGLLPDYYPRYPHEFSGGQRQRIGIARALAVQPEFIVCDESVSALDVSVQAQILNLLNDLKEEFGFTYLFISHDLQIVKYFCDRVLVIQNGKLVESGFSEEIYREPKEEYTQKLIAAVEA
jgi:peptide/nickel transport system ATP-binding protein